MRTIYIHILKKVIDGLDIIMIGVFNQAPIVKDN
jgi:hypothetical protein